MYSDSIRSTDPLEAKALSFKNDLIDIYSNSWGPGDRAFEVKGPGPLLKEMLNNGTRLVCNNSVIYGYSTGCLRNMPSVHTFF